MDNDNHQETDYDALEQKEAVRKFVEDRVAKYIVSRNGREADQLPPAPVAEELSSEPVAWRYRVKGYDWELFDSCPFAGADISPGPKEELEPLYTHPQPAVPEGWRPVPEEITLDMQRAYFDVIDRNLGRVSTDCRFGRFDSQREAYRAMLTAAPAAPAKPAVPDVDALAQHIRTIDGNNDMGAGALAESICNWIEEQNNDR